MKALRLGRYKFRLRLPTRGVVVVWGGARAFLAPFLVDEEMEFVNPDERTFHLFTLVQCLIRRRWSAEDYYSLFLKKVAPRIVLTFMDNDTLCYRVAKRVTDIQFIVIQNGFRSAMSSSPDLEPPIEEICNSDLQTENLILGRFGLHQYGKGVASQPAPFRSAPIGSVMNNFFESVYPDEQVERVVFVSSLPADRGLGVNPLDSDEISFWLHGRPMRFSETWKADAEVAGLVVQFCHEVHLPLLVCAKRPIRTKYETRFFDDICRTLNKYVIHHPIREHDSYSVLQSSDLIVTLDSTFGYECLARGFRVVFLNVRTSQLGRADIVDFTFAYGLFGSMGPFWTNSQAHSDWKATLNSVLKLSSTEWRTVSSLYADSVMVHDYGNTRLLELLESLGVKTRKSNESSMVWMPTI